MKKTNSLEIDIREKIQNGHYDNTLTYPSGRGGSGQRFYFLEYGKKLKEKFKKDALRSVGLSEHPRADEIFQLAWDQKYIEGYEAVLRALESAAKLSLKTKNN